MKQKTDEKLVTKVLARSKSYRQMDTVRLEMVNVLRHYRGLKPELDVFVFDNGEERNLVNLNGTIPVEYRGNTYNIPVCFWLLHDHPTSPPMAFVRPTQDMRIKVSPLVDASGRINLAYLDTWRYPESQLLGLVQHCRVSFGESPPVFAKTTRQVSMSDLGDNATASGYQRSSSCSASISGNATDSGLSDEQLRESLVSAAEEILKEKLSEEFSKTKAELESLHATSRELLDGQEKLVEIDKSMNDKTAELESFMNELKTQESDMTAALERLEIFETDTSILNVDQGVVTVETPVHRQIVEAFVEDSSIDDAIYALGEALRLGHLSWEIYLKKVRNLSRKQFFLRALMNKCRERAGLVDSS